MIATLWAEPAISNPPSRSRRDWLLAGVVVVGTTLEVVVRSDFVWPVLGLVFGVMLAGAALIRRTGPLVGAAVGFGGFAAIDIATILADREPFSLGAGAVVLVSAYCLFRWGSARHAAIGLVAMATAVTTGSAVDYNGADDAVGGAAVVLLAAVLGATVRYRRAARDQLVEQARMQERQQIARELHDTVAHHVSAIAIQARAALIEVDARSLDDASNSLRTIASEATLTMTEMRSMVGLLRTDGGRVGKVEHSSMSDLERLTARSTPHTVVTVQNTVDPTTCSSMLATTMYRVAQESVTNALRHARSARRIDVTVTAQSAEIELVIADDGVGSTDRSRSGYGLAGMGERVELLGGSLQAGPQPSGGWTVRAVLPR